MDGWMGKEGDIGLLGMWELELEPGAEGWIGFGRRENMVGWDGVWL
jgi:hypothetical protein